jgi:hypothetical protein
VERPAKDSPGGGHEGNQALETLLEGLELTGRREMQLAGARLPLRHGCRVAAPAPAEEDAQGEEGASRGENSRGRGAGGRG